jgi:DNA topoisomerase-1
MAARRASAPELLDLDPRESAQHAGLRYVSDAQPGIYRQKRGPRFSYRDADGQSVDEPTLQRIRALAIPPAWTDVWICPNPRGHLQATGRDARGRKQYRYHPRWAAVRDRVKYDRMIALGEALPRIRERIEQDLRRSDMPREKILAALVRLLEETRIRVGNDEYARQNRSFGLTTLRNRHVSVEGSRVTFQFRGKSGKDHRVSLLDRRLARVVKRCQEIPGHELFQCLDCDGTRHSIESDDVNAYIREASGGDFTAKDFRTWAGTVLAARFLRQVEPEASEREVKSQVTRAIEQVAEQLGNTPAVCRKSYVHPAVIEAFQAGALGHLKGPEDAVPPGSPYALSADEQLVLDFLRTAVAAAEEPMQRAA